MFYEEKVIDGVLCFRTLPNGRWFVVSADDLNLKLIQAREEASALRARLATLAEGDPVAELRKIANNLGVCGLPGLRDATRTIADAIEKALAGFAQPMRSAR